MYEHVYYVRPRQVEDLHPAVLDAVGLHDDGRVQLPGILELEASVLVA